TPDTYTLSLHDALPIYTMMFTTMRKPSTPPGNDVSRCSTHRSPFTPRKVRLKIVEPTRMNITKLVMSAVDSTACLSSENDSLRRSEEHTSELQSQSNLV